MSQKIVIPRGTVNPNETTVVDIPNDLRGSAVVVAKKKGPSMGARPGSPTGEWSSMQSRGARQSPRLRAGAPSADPRSMCPAYPKGAGAPSNLGSSTADQMRDLDRIDIVEQNQLSDDLRDFQQMRRKLVKDVSNIAGASPTAHKDLPKSVFNPKRLDKMVTRHMY
ncbi:uncharacterized protein [Leptinotarsa decemlineata]|uniref:uncharacterized protein n=1 Tax=Leptinotarsa decemlineata TaxID=7539 RepID=UPI003D305C13